MFHVANAESPSISVEAPVFFNEEWSAAKGESSTKFDYAHRLNRYRPVSEVDEGGARYGDLVASGHGNLPAWAQHRPRILWEACDFFERKKGPASKGFITALPREGSLQQLVDLSEEICKKRFGTAYAYSWALHMVEASDGGMNPHLHVMYSPRIIDANIPLGMKQHFKKFNAAVPERGGYRKEPWLPTRWERSIALKQRRAAIAAVLNDFLMQLAVRRRVTSASYRSRGIDLRGEPKRRRRAAASHQDEIMQERAARTALVAALESLEHARWSFLQFWNSGAGDRLLERQSDTQAAAAGVGRSLASHPTNHRVNGIKHLESASRSGVSEQSPISDVTVNTAIPKSQLGIGNVGVDHVHHALASPESDRSRKFREEMFKQFSPRSLREAPEESQVGDADKVEMGPDES